MNLRSLSAALAVFTLLVTGVASAECPAERLGKGSQTKVTGVDAGMLSANEGIDRNEPRERDWLRNVVFKGMEESAPCYAPQYVERAHFELVVGAAPDGRVAKEALALAQARIDHALAIDPKLGDAYAIQGEIRRQRGDAKGAKADLDKAATLGATHPLLTMHQALLAVDAGDCKAAGASFGKVIANRRTQPNLAARAQAGLEKCRGASVAPAMTPPGDPPSAEALAKAMSTDCKATGAALRELSKEQSERLASAVTAIDAPSASIAPAARVVLQKLLIERPCSGQVLRELARYAIKSGDPQGAEAMIQKGLTADPGFSGIHVLAGHWFATTNRLPQARAALTKAEALRSTDPWLDLNWATLLLREGSVKAAMDRLERGLANPQADVRIRVAALSELATLYHPKPTATEGLNDPQTAWRKAVALAPQNRLVLGAYARFQLCGVHSNPAGAETNARAALKGDSNPHARQTLAAALYLLWADHVQGQDYFKADREYGEAAALFPGVPPDAVMGQTCRDDLLVRRVREGMAAQEKRPKK